MRQKRCCITYCFLSLQENRHKRRQRKSSPVGRSYSMLSYPHIWGNRKAIHMQIQVSPCTEHRLEKKNSKLASQTPNNVRKDASDNTDVTRRKHQTQPEKLHGKRKLSIKVSERTLWVSRQCKTHAHFCFFGFFSFLHSIAWKNFFFLFFFAVQLPCARNQQEMNQLPKYLRGSCESFKWNYKRHHFWAAVLDSDQRQTKVW